MGVCHTFNGNISEKRVTINEYGRLHGFEAVFYINQGEYVGNLAQKAGIQLVVHEPGRMPLPGIEGVALAPGLETLVGIKKVSTDILNSYCKTNIEMLLSA